MIANNTTAKNKIAETIAIVDYGAGNLNSVKKAFDHLGANVVVTSEPGKLAAAGKIVLPGVGHFSALGGLVNMGLREAVLRATRAGKPLLGICLGMQWLFEGSDEAPQLAGAGIFPGRCCPFPSSVKSPHVGWNSLTVREDSRLLRDIAPESFVYFTHSFQAPVVAATAASAEYGTRFSAVVEKENIFGVQFHPEKSWNVGLRMLKNFCELD
ncbi:MAG TPA: imidazole glycerol phosphate synthase subunit HisH [Terriglobales bacterium]|jgi:glutamine amidotransferase|nr:imidazole glycerol phosphate synthase subunit HisH [Terriglobales bacterium]